jgi:hypothetical protein
MRCGHLDRTAPLLLLFYLKALLMRALISSLLYSIALLVVGLLCAYIACVAAIIFDATHDFIALLNVFAFLSFAVLCGLELVRYLDAQTDAAVRAFVNRY